MLCDNSSRGVSLSSPPLSAWKSAGKPDTERQRGFYSIHCEYRGGKSTFAVLYVISVNCQRVNLCVCAGDCEHMQRACLCFFLCVCVSVKE